MRQAEGWIEAVMPEQAGIPRQAAAEFLKRLEDSRISVHSVLMARRGAVFLEKYYRPFGPDRLHRMFSVTKSLVSLAVGLLADEGRLALDDPIIAYFPEYAPAKPHPFLREMTIRDLLTMRTCHAATTYKEHLDRNWVESFFQKEPDHKPGTIFCYDTSGSHTLCAMAEKLTGRPLLDYLREKCLDEIGFSREAYVIRDPFGISMGGSGLMAKPMDLLRLGILLLEHGSFRGRQLLPRWYLQEATACQTPTAAKGETVEERQGYGYLFWRTRHQGYACCGMGGQLLICLPKYELICVTTADTMDTKGGCQTLYQCFFDTIIRSLTEEGKITEAPAPEAPAETVLRTINGRVYTLDDRQPKMKEICFLLEPDNSGAMIYDGSEGKHRLSFRLNEEVETMVPRYEEPGLVSASWLDAKTLYLTAELLGEHLGSMACQAVFDGEDLTLFWRQTVEQGLPEFQGFRNGSARKHIRVKE